MDSQYRDSETSYSGTDGPEGVVDMNLGRRHEIGKGRKKKEERKRVRDEGVQRENDPSGYQRI